ncbi:MAG TPA: cation:proton antiporter, partial [Candidatus Limnocylindria bacterium]|nr:cation:proton antiporter [Candidatus Limnocylindria bacterium]
MTGGLGLTLFAALGAALILGAVAHRLRLPPMFGYIVAGLVVGPFTPGVVADRERVLELADIGVALLMFSIGLRFSLRELASVGRLVLIGAPIQVAITMALGTVAALLLGRELVESLFVGAIVSICSSVVLVKVAGESVLETLLSGRIALGWSIVQDLITVVLVVVLSALAVESPSPLLDALRSTAIALGFVAVVVLLGSRVYTALLERVARLGSRELFIVAVALIAIGTAYSASALGVSVALGAFIAGLALAESDLAASVLGEVVPLRELFATVFFVSIGILLQPSAVLTGWPIILLLLALIIAGKWLPIFGIVTAAGHRPAVAARAAGLIAQSGEFSFVLATAGLSVGAIDPETFSLAMEATVFSILLAGPVFYGSGRLADALERRASRVPERLEDLHPPRRHAVVLGYGRVGRQIGRMLESRSFPWMAVDVDFPLVRRSRGAGAPVIYGDAGTPSILDAAGIADARLLIIAHPDAMAARQAVAHARRSNPRIEIVARSHSEADEAELRRLGVARVVIAERQVG